jgi:LCP family protein required for cell wall assembly
MHDRTPPGGLHGAPTDDAGWDDQSASVGVSEPHRHATAPPSAQPGRPTAWPRRLVVVSLILLVALVVVGVGGYVYVNVRLGQIHRIAVAGLTPVSSGQPQNFLLAGSDSRAGESAPAAQQFGSASQVPGQRSDVIIVVHLDPGAHTAAMLSIPRDFFVPIAGTGSSNRINVAFNNGPSQLVQSVSQDLGIPINHYAQVDFSGLQQLTNTVGGVCLSFPYPVRDGSPTGTGNESGLSIPVAGHHVLNGTAALGFVRSRYYQYFSAGSWHAEGTGDIGRIARQHEYMRALASKISHSALHNPLTANAVLNHGVHAVTVDRSLSSSGLLRLALAMRSVHPSAIPSWTLPYRAVNNYGSYGDVLMPDSAQDRLVIAAWSSYRPPSAKSTPPSTVAPSSVTVRVLNGSGTAGQAALAAQAMRSAGFQVSGYATAAAAGHPATTVAYPAGDRAQAQTVAGYLQGPVALTQTNTGTAGLIIVTTGTSFGGVASPHASASPATTVAPDTARPPWDPTAC